MHFSLSVLALLAGTAAAQRACGNVNTPPALKAEAQRFGALNKAMKNLRAGDADVDAAQPRTQVINVWWHNVYINRTAAGGYISNDDMQRQHDAMNAHFKGTGISFKLKRTRHEKNAKWATYGIDDTETEQEMKRHLRRGTYKDLNVYLRPLPDYLGWCTFPDDVMPGSDAYYSDGCDVVQNSIPGGSFVPYDEGKTATHEVGHWLGLFHTFQDGCDGGDLVDDTPAEAEPAFGCPVGRDTCPGGGVDPIHNFMDYSDDACLEEFSPGQVTRIFQNWDKYRAPWN